jgi:hypothetical protein
MSGNRKIGAGKLSVAVCDDSRCVIGAERAEDATRNCRCLLRAFVLELLSQLGAAFEGRLGTAAVPAIKIEGKVRPNP